MSEKLELENVALEIRMAWEASHNNCDLDRAQLRYTFLRRISVWSFLVAILGLAFFTMGTCFLLPSMPINYAILLMTVGGAVSMGQLFAVMFAIEWPTEAIRSFNRDASKLKDAIGCSFTKTYTSSLPSARDALVKIATSIRLAELEGDEARMATERNKILELYNLLADFGLVERAENPKFPELLRFFVAAEAKVRDIVLRMTERLGVTRQPGNLRHQAPKS